LKILEEKSVRNSLEEKEGMMCDRMNRDRRNRYEDTKRLSERIRKLEEKYLERQKKN
jgi:hypothetical protein